MHRFECVLLRHLHRWPVPSDECVSAVGFCLHRIERLLQRLNLLLCDWFNARHLPGLDMLELWADLRNRRPNVLHRVDLFERQLRLVRRDRPVYLHGRHQLALAIDPVLRRFRTTQRRPQPL